MYEYHFKDLERLRQKFDRKLINRAKKTSLTRAAQQTRTFISRAIREVYNVKSGAISKRVAMKVDRTNGDWVALVFRGPRIGLINFGARAKKVTLGRKPRRGQKGVRFGRFRQGVTVKVLKSGGRKLVGQGRMVARSTGVPQGVNLGRSKSAGFIATGGGGNQHIFYRLPGKGGAAKDRLEAAYAWSIPEMMANANGAVGSRGSYEEFAFGVHAKEFDAAMRYYLEKANAAGD